MQRNCAVCDTPFEHQRPQAKYCGNTCRQRGKRAGIATPVTSAPVVERETSNLVDAVRAELELAGKLNGVSGQHALELANRIVSAPGMNTGVAALSRQLQSVLAEALRNAAHEVNPLDELRARRDRKRRTG